MNISPSSLCETRAGGICWSLTPDLRQPLLDDAGLRLAEWLRTGQAHVVKQGPHRIVYRVELPGMCFYLKHNRVTDARAWLRQLVRPSKARREYDSMVAVAARGVPTVSPLALGERPALRGGESYLITRSLEGCEPLHVFLVHMLPQLAPARRTRVRQRLAQELGALVARIHDAGVRHNDLHAGNILVCHGADDRLELYLIDLNAVHIGAPLDWASSLDNLVMLNSWFVLRCNRADRLRFWKAYHLGRGMGEWSKGPHGGKEHRHRAAAIEQGTWLFNFRFWRRRDARSLRDNRYYRRVAAPGVIGHAVTEIHDANLAPLLADPDEPFRRPGVRFLKDSPSSTVAEMEMEVDGRPLRVVYKRFRITSALEPFVSLLRRTPALRSWVHGQGFRERTLPTARTLAVLHRTRWGMRAEGYLLTEKLEHAQELHTHLEDLQQLPNRQRMELTRLQIDRVAHTIRDLHQRQFSHRDLKAANILVRRWNAPPAEPSTVSPPAHLGLLHVPETTVWLIDLVGVELFHAVPRGRRVQNLARLNASFHRTTFLTRTDRLRFLRTYLNWGLCGQGNWKAWWKAIDRGTQGKIARNRRRGRPLE
jgi:tRNA A-37 threonylcarbamoyl transferase component Bud32